MSKGAQLWPGETMRAFFRAHIRRTTSLDEAAVNTLADALTRATNRMLVWDVPEDENAPAPQPAAIETATPSFNPFAFSATVTFAKSGAAGLMKRLKPIKLAENLKALAEAQHLAVDPLLSEADDLRKAIIAAAEQRLADRKAAAS